MRKTKISDEELMKAARAVRETMLSSFPENEEHEFSDSFEAKMSGLLRNKEYNNFSSEYFKVLHRAARRSAAVLAAMVICISAWLTVDDGSRVKVVDWIGKINEESIIYRHFGNSENFVNSTMNFTV